MALPTTVTTAKQSTAKGRRTRQANLNAEADSQPSNAVIPRPTPANIPGLTDVDISHELLEYFHSHGMTRDQIRTTASTWLITQAELQQWEAKIDKADTQEQARVDRETAKLAAQMETCILQRGEVQTMAIRGATAERLLEFIDYYEAELDETYEVLHEFDTDVMTPARLEARDQWDRLNGYLWECKVQAGIHPVTLKTFTGQDLEHELDHALKEASKP